MPTYEYVCDRCGPVEILQSMRDAALTKCPTCSSRSFTRVISGGVGVIFKGDGFWETDYNRSADYKAKQQADRAPAPATTGQADAAPQPKPQLQPAPQSDAKSASKSDAKAQEKSEPKAEPQRSSGAPAQSEVKPQTKSDSKTASTRPPRNA